MEREGKEKKEKESKGIKRKEKETEEIQSYRKERKSLEKMLKKSLGSRSWTFLSLVLAEQGCPFTFKYETVLLF